MEIHFLSGYGDAALIRLGNVNVLIDTGYDAEHAANYIAQLGIDHIDMIFVTSFGTCSTGGLKRLTERFTVDELIVPDVAMSHLPRVTQRLLNDIESQGDVTLTRLGTDDVGRIISVGGAELKVIAPSVVEYEDSYRCTSISLRLTHGSCDVGFLSDTDSANIAVMLANDYIDKVDVLCLANHGDASVNTGELLAAAAPSYAISAPASSSFVGEVVDVSQYGITHISTLDNTCVLVSDGVSIKPKE